MGRHDSRWGWPEIGVSALELHACRLVRQRSLSLLISGAGNLCRFIQSHCFFVQATSCPYSVNDICSCHLEGRVRLICQAVAIKNLKAVNAPMQPYPL